ncbi:MAG: hypothetical protein IPM42_07720 [Saprospiraceae bacterium]|nr:hypothetical protein [Saprospiraceae bacterium]
MKFQILTLNAFFICSTLYGQNIINVNNTSTGVTTQYTTLQAAVTAAVEGDIIYLYPSSTSYGSATINKRLTIIGPGYNVQQNPSLQITTYVSNAILDNITFAVGSNDGVITGCDINYMVLNGQSNVQITRNKIRNRIYLSNTNNILVEGCYFELVSSAQCYGVGADGNWANLSANTNNNSIIVKNNLFFAREERTPSCNTCNSGTSFMDNLLIGATSNAIIENNIFRDNCHISNSILRNNIFLSTFQVNCSVTTIQNNGGNFFENNILVANQGGLGSTNIINVPEANIFEGWPIQGSRTFDDRFMLKAGSPALGAGVGGVDCGAFGSSKPYKLSGIPFIPIIYQINAPTSGTAASGLNVNVKVRASN